MKIAFGLLMLFGLLHLYMTLHTTSNPHGLPIWAERFVTETETPVNCDGWLYYHWRTITGSTKTPACRHLPEIEVTCKNYLVIREVLFDRLLSWVIPRSPNVYMCTDKIRPRGKCIVYWFGIGQDWSGPEQMVQDLGCDVYAYDPDPQPLPVPKGVHYEQLGIGNETGIFRGETSTAYSGQAGFKIETLKDLLKRNGHDGNNKVDVLRVDTEGAEYGMFSTIDDQTLSHFGQLAMEIHSGGSHHDRHGSSDQACDINWFREKSQNAGAELKTFYAAHNCHGPAHVIEIGFLINF